MRITGNVHVERPPEVVFPLWAALERAPEYLDGFQRIKQTDGPVGLGTRWQAIDQWPGKTVEFVVEIVEWEPHTSMRASFSDPMNGGWRAVFTPSGDRATDVEVEMEMQPAGLMGVLATLTRPWAGRQIRKFLTNFKAWAEAQPASAQG